MIEQWPAAIPVLVIIFIAADGVTILGHTGDGELTIDHYPFEWTETIIRSAAERVRS